MGEARATGLIGAVLAGGRSSRFGRDKSQIRIAGETLLERVRGLLGVVGDVVVIGGVASEVIEPEPGAGPLQAVIAALCEARRRGASGAVVVACDLPMLDSETVARLAEPLPEGATARVPRVAGRLQVLAARWSVAALDELEAAWQAGERSLTRACARLVIDVDDEWNGAALADVDTPEDLARLMAGGSGSGPVAEVEVRRWPAGEQAMDRVAREEPLEIVVAGQPIAVLLRTPAGVEHDLSLVAGFLLSEGVIERLSDLDGLAPCLDPAAENRENRVMVTLAPGVTLPDGARRLFVSGASCGLCGKAAIEALVQRLPERAERAPPLLAHIDAMGALVSAMQAGFASTGALHAAALFEGGRLLAVAEDVGRHNAVDKVFGSALRAERLPLVGETLWVSGRVSFELVQKALLAGIDALVAVGAPTSLAVALAAAGGLHLIGFARDARANVYAGAVSTEAGA